MQNALAIYCIRNGVIYRIVILTLPLIPLRFQRLHQGQKDKKSAANLSMQQLKNKKLVTGIIKSEGG